VRTFYDDEGMNFAVLLGLGFVYHGIADAGETLATIQRVSEGDRDTWVREWRATADRLRDDGEAAEKRGHRVSARAKLLRASTYYDHASSASPGTTYDDQFTPLWERHRDCWDRAVALFDPPVEPIEIPYEGTTLAGYFFRPDTTGAPRPTFILNNGSDGPVISQWSLGGHAAVERGWNAITFDGPGQGAALHRQKLYFRHDWEKVVTPVVDFLVSRPDVDPHKIVLQGVSQAGYWAPRAAAFERRLAALVADPGVIDVASSWTQHFPKDLVQLLDEGNKKDFDALMDAADKTQKAILAWRRAPYGTSSTYDALVAARRMHLDNDTINQIECPTLITDPDHEQFWPGQSQQLYDALTCPKHLVRFTEQEGADWHCEPAAQALRDERVFDWLEETLELGG
jgi:alpha-beta hydrolase superfamily lysophospholipase